MFALFFSILFWLYHIYITYHRWKHIIHLIKSGVANARILNYLIKYFIKIISIILSNHISKLNCALHCNVSDTYSIIFILANINMILIIRQIMQSTLSALQVSKKNIKLYNYKRGNKNCQ